MRFFERYTGFWRRWKLLYVFYNLLNINKLNYLKAGFRKYGIKRPLFFPLHAKHFSHLPKAMDASTDEQWNRDGYSVVEGFIGEEEVDRINSAISSALASGELAFNYTGRKIHFAYEKIKGIRELMNRPSLIALLEEKLGSEIVPFQSINFQYGSEQKAHSDSVHMSTYPQGGLIAVWIALDNVSDENGPLFYYPASHKWPYVSNADIGASTSWILSPNPNKMYEDYIAKKIEEGGIQPERFYAKKGDALIWHANLLHGGMPHLNKKLSRRSLVIHYFRKGDICYHEISQRPALIAAL